MNILWLPLAIGSYLLLSVNGVVDRAIVHQEKTKPIVISFWVALFSVATFALILLGFLPGEQFENMSLQNIDGDIILLAVLGGFMTQAGLLFMYRALEYGEATRVLSIMGALTPIASFIGAYLYLDERLESITTVAFVLLIIATVILTIEPNKKSQATHVKWIINAVLASAFIGAQAVVIKHVFNNAEFISAFALTGLGAGVYVLVIAALSGDVRKEIKGLLGLNKTKSKKKKKNQTSSQVKWIFANSILGGVAVMLLNLSIDLGSPTLVNALRGVQYAGVFLIALLLAKKLPKLLEEDLSRKSITLKLSGIALIIGGVVILAVSA